MDTNISMTKANLTKKTTALIILDGWGYSEKIESNAILQANTPFWDQLWKERPHNLIQTSGMAVGLPEGQMGNSEVGHMNLGAGRIVYQNFTRITKDIADKTFELNPALNKAIDSAISQNKAVHLLGLVSPGGVHSHEDHIEAAINLAANKGANAIIVKRCMEINDPSSGCISQVICMGQAIKEIKQ